MPHFTHIEFGSPLYKQELELRQSILRTPLGLNIYDEDLSLESMQLHFGLLEKDQLIACVVATHLENERAKIRQMAIAKDHQGQGLGRMILLKTEDKLRDLGTSSVELHARKTAIPFYQKLGYQIEGNEFIEVTIPHVRMVKLLPPHPHNQ